MKTRLKYHLVERGLALADRTRDLAKDATLERIWRTFRVDCGEDWRLEIRDSVNWN